MFNTIHHINLSIVSINCFFYHFVMSNNANKLNKLSKTMILNICSTVHIHQKNDDHQHQQLVEFHQYDSTKLKQHSRKESQSKKLPLGIKVTLKEINNHNQSQSTIKNQRFDLEMPKKDASCQTNLLNQQINRSLRRTKRVNVNMLSSASKPSLSIKISGSIHDIQTNISESAFQIQRKISVPTIQCIDRQESRESLKEPFNVYRSAHHIYGNRMGVHGVTLKTIESIDTEMQNNIQGNNINQIKSKVRFDESIIQKMSILQNFQTIKLIDTNSYSIDFVALEKNINFLICIKRIHQKFIQKITIEIRIQHEIGQHINLLKLYTTIVDGEQYLLLYEYFQTSLKEKCGKITIESQVVQYVRNIIQGIQYLFDHDIIYNQLNCENIKVVNGICKLTDFYNTRKLTNEQNKYQNMIINYLMIGRIVIELMQIQMILEQQVNIFRGKIMSDNLANFLDLLFNPKNQQQFLSFKDLKSHSWLNQQQQQLSQNYSTPLITLYKSNHIL